MANSTGRQLPLDRRLRPKAWEFAALIAVAAASILAVYPFFHDGIIGGDDARWYCTVVADYILQARAGHWPVFVGQSEYAAVGTVFPLRVAPYLQHLAALIDVATGQSLPPFRLLNWAVVLSGLGGGLSAYLCLRSITTPRAESALLAALYVWCPAIIGLAYAGQLYMSVMTWPFLPVVFTGVVHIYRTCERKAGWLMVVCGCSACWLGHSPIGLWSCACAGLMIAIKIVTARHRARLAMPLVVSSVAFLALCGYVFVSVRVLSAPSTADTSRANLFSTIQHSFPGVLLPVQGREGHLTSIQPGYAVLLLLGTCLVVACRSRSALNLAFGATCCLIVFLVSPVPGITELLWRLVPQTIVNVTNAAPAQRLLPILAAIVVVWSGTAITSLNSNLGFGRRLVYALAVALAWSGLQLSEFLDYAKQLSNSPERSRQLLSPENLTLTRYSTSLLAENNAFFSHGVVNFALEQHILREDFSRYVTGNYASLQGGEESQAATQIISSGEFRGAPEKTDPRFIPLSPKLKLDPNSHYVLNFQFSPDRLPTGVLQFHGSGFAREYHLPSSGGKRAFGALPGSSRALPLWTESDKPVEVAATYIHLDPDTSPQGFRAFGRFEFTKYDSATLPIRLHSFVPYTASVSSPESGWLETFRYHTPGWTAEVDGEKVSIRQSDNGLVAVPIPKGESSVTLHFIPPPLLKVSYWLSLVSWLGVLGFAAYRTFEEVSRRRARTAAAGGPL